MDTHPITIVHEKDKMNVARVVSGNMMIVVPVFVVTDKNISEF